MQRNVNEDRWASGFHDLVAWMLCLFMTMWLESGRETGENPHVAFILSLSSYWCISVSLKFCSVYSKWLQILEDRGLTLGLDCCIESPVSFHRKSCLRSWNLWCSKNNLTACVTGRGYSPEQGFQKCGGNEAEKRLTYFHMGQYTPDLYGQKQRASVMGPGPVCQHAWTCLWCPFLWLVMMLDLSLSGGVRTV